MGDWLDDVRTQYGRDWDSLKPEFRTADKDSWVNDRVKALSDNPGSVSDAQEFVNVHTGDAAIKDYGRAYCEAEKLPQSPLAMLPPVSASAGVNLIYGLNVCVYLDTSGYETRNDQEYKFAERIHQDLCPTSAAVPAPPGVKLGGS